MTIDLADITACWRAGGQCRPAGRHYSWANSTELHVADLTAAVGVQHVATLADPARSSTIYRIAQVSR